MDVSYWLIPEYEFLFVIYGPKGVNILMYTAILLDPYIYGQTAL